MPDHSSSPLPMDIVIVQAAIAGEYALLQCGSLNSKLPSQMCSCGSNIMVQASAGSVDDFSKARSFAE